MSVNIDDIEMEEAPTYAPSLPVPNVQEMVKMNPLEVPTKYVRNEEEMEKVNYMPQLSSEIPVIDFTLLSNGSMEELLKLEIACKEWGFFQVIHQL
ncbi:putative (S)-norcoclaurine synthase [Medicago truncatula]|uniref:Putative (S)-norcoclaurine synthase n=1 Tax=Medicago truncatula TaxID=3880 RepID=A0A396GYH0_MEDTR|nr:putative (S)-norcoclaurine synthase [Medicago truncatula]